MRASIRYEFLYIFGKPCVGKYSVVDSLVQGIEFFLLPCMKPVFY